MEGVGSYQFQGLSLYHHGCGLPAPPEYQAERAWPCLCGLSDLRRPPRENEYESGEECLALQLLQRERRDAGSLRQGLWYQQFRCLS